MARPNAEQRTGEKGAGRIKNIPDANQRFVGDSGSEVSALTIALEKEGLVNKTTNNFDEAVASAVTGFQQKYKEETLVPWGLQYGTGFVGSTTRAKLNSLYGCGVVSIPTSVPTPTPVSTTTPSITVLSPNGGESWTVGEAKTITWKSNGVNYVRIYIIYYSNIAGSGLSNYISSSVLASKGSFTWIVPSLNQLPGGGETYKIRIDDNTNSAINDQSDASFSIAAVATASTSTSANLNQMASALESARTILNQILESLKNR